MILLIKRNEIFWVFGFGATVYGIIEVLFRGYTHWTMAIAGGMAFTLIYLVNITIKTESLIIRCLIGSAIITSIEFVCGVVVNVFLGMNVWDYSQEQYNVLGQICPLFSFIWFLVCIPATLLTFVFRRYLFGREIIGT